jgi:serine/threonine protein kinase
MSSSGGPAIAAAAPLLLQAPAPGGVVLVDHQHQQQQQQQQQPIVTPDAAHDDAQQQQQQALTNGGGYQQQQQHSLFNSWQTMTRTLAHYERLEQIGEGTYGQVYRARCKDSNSIVALKKMRIHHAGYMGMPLQLIREIKILKRLHHENLLHLMEVVTSKGVEHLDINDPITTNTSRNNAENSNAKAMHPDAIDAREGYKGNLFLVLEYVQHDLTGLLDVAYPFSPIQIKCIFRQLLQALSFMHAHKYVHRDIKSSVRVFQRFNTGTHARRHKIHRTAP